MSRAIRKLTILGDGGWGTALACLACDNGLATTMWGHDPIYLQVMEGSRTNPKFLPGIRMPAALRYEPNIRKAVDGSDLILSAVPTIFLRSSYKDLAGAIPEGVGVISVTKGIEQGTLLRPTQILAEVLGCTRLGVLAGPSHAEEVARGCPTTVAVASEDADLAIETQDALRGPTFRVYTGDDPVGMELGGALKNVLALTAGACLALDLGDNAVAALVTRGLSEMMRLGVRMGAKPETFYGLAGLGDLVVTCFSHHSRNRTIGFEAVKSHSIRHALDAHETVPEGVYTSRAVVELAQKLDLELPIFEHVAKVLWEDLDPREAVISLMGREAGSEHRRQETNN